MNQDFSIIHLLLNASWVVQAVVLLLMGVVALGISWLVRHSGESLPALMQRMA